MVQPVILSIWSKKFLFILKLADYWTQQLISLAPEKKQVLAEEILNHWHAGKTIERALVDLHQKKGFTFVGDSHFDTQFVKMSFFEHLRPHLNPAEIHTLLGDGQKINKIKI